jgi:hypothetical protein
MLSRKEEDRERKAVLRNDALVRQEREQLGQNTKLGRVGTQAKQLR